MENIEEYGRERKLIKEIIKEMGIKDASRLQKTLAALNAANSANVLLIHRNLCKRKLEQERAVRKELLGW